MGRPSLMLHVLQSEEGNGIIIDSWAQGKRHLIVLDGGEKRPKHFERSSPAHGLIHRQLTSAARDAWYHAADGNDASTLDFQPTAMISIQSHDPYQGFLALLNLYATSGPRPLFVLPNPVNIQDGWKSFSSVRGRFVAINKYLRKRQFEAKKEVSANMFPGLEFSYPNVSKMACYEHVTGSQNVEDFRELTQPCPNSQSTLFTATQESGGAILLATNTSDRRILANCVKTDSTHFSIYQIQDKASIIHRQPTIDVEVCSELSLWGLMELGYDKLGFTEEQKKECPPLREGDALYAVLPAIVTKLCAWDKKISLATWSASSHRTVLNLDWLRSLEISQGLERQVPFALQYLASILKDLFQDHDLCKYLSTLRSRQQEYLSLCRIVDRHLAELGLSTHPNLSLSTPCSNLVAQIGERLESLCLKNTIPDPQSEPIRLGLFSIGEFRDGSIRAYAELWSHWTVSEDLISVTRWSDLYVSIIKTFRAQRHYSQFSANTYFISPQGSEPEDNSMIPCEIVGLAIAMASFNPRRKASLFLPSTRQLDWVAVTQLATVLGQDIANLFGPEKLSILRSRADGMYVSLNGSGPLPDEGVDIMSWLEAMPELSSANLGKLSPSILMTKELFEGRDNISSQGLNFPSFSEQLFQIICKHGTAKSDLYLQGDVSVFPEEPVIRPRGPYPPPFKVTSAKPQHGLRVFNAPGNNADGWHLGIFGANPVGSLPSVPYRVVASATHTTDPTAQRLYKLRFEYPEGSKRYFAFYYDKETAEPSILEVRQEKQANGPNLTEASFAIETVDEKGSTKTFPVGEPVSLKAFLHDAETKPDNEKAFHLPLVLASLVGRSESYVNGLLNERLPTSLLNGSNVDLDESSVILLRTALGGHRVAQSTLICKKPSDGSEYILTPDMKMHTEIVSFSLEHVGTPNCRFTVKVKASLTTNDGVTWPAIVTTTFYLNLSERNNLPEWSLRFDHNIPTPDQLFRTLKVSPSLSDPESEVMKSSPPLLNSPSGMMPSLGTILSGDLVTDIELLYKQTHFALPYFLLSSMTFEAKLVNWPKNLIELDSSRIQRQPEPLTRIKVRNPTLKNGVRLDTAIDFLYSFEAAKDTILPFSFTGQSLIARHDYANILSFHLGETDSSELSDMRVNLHTILDYIQHAPVWGYLKDESPLGHNSLAKGKIKSFSSRLETRPDGDGLFQTGDFEIEFECDLIPLANGTTDIDLHLSSAQMILQVCCGVIKCEGKGIVWVRDRSHPAEVRLPQKDMPGFVTLRNIPGSTFSSMLRVSQFLNLPLLKILSETFKATIESVQFPLPDSADIEPTIMDKGSINFRFYCSDRLEVQNLPTLRAVQGSIDLGIPRPSTGEQNIQFEVYGETVDDMLSVTIGSGPPEKPIKATFYPTEDLSVSATFAAALAVVETPQFVADALVSSAIVTLANTSAGLRPRSCVMKLVPSTVITIEAAKASDLEVVCDIRQAAETGKNTVSNLKLVWTDSATTTMGRFEVELLGDQKVLTLQFIPSETDQARLYGILDKFGLPRPSRLDIPAELKVEDVMNYPFLRNWGAVGPLELSGSPMKYDIRQLSIVLDSPQTSTNRLVLSTSRQIYLESFKLDVFYSKASRSTSAVFKGYVKMFSGFETYVRLSRTGDREVYYDNGFTLGSPKSADSPPTYEELAATLLPNAESLAIPSGSRVIQPLPFASGKCYFVVRQSASISVTLNATKWHYEFGDLTLSFSGLKGHVSLIEGEKQKWRAALIGNTFLGSFAAVQGVIQLCASKKPVLAGRLTKAPSSESISPVDDVESFVKDISQDAGSWELIRPTNAPTLSLDPNAAMYLSFDTSSIIITGSIGNLGGVTIMGRRAKGEPGKAKGASKNIFLVSVGLSEPSALWKELAADLSNHFTFRSVTAFFSSAVWEPSDLAHIIEDAKYASVEFNETIEDGPKLDSALSAASHLASRATAINPGAQFEAVIAIGSDAGQGFSDSFRELAAPDTNPIITLAAKREKGEFEFRVTIRDLKLFGEAIVLKNASGAFSPNLGKAEGKKGVPTLTFESELDLNIPDTKAVLALTSHGILTKELFKFDVLLANASQSQVTIPNPFGKSFGLEFKMLKFNGLIYLKGSKSSKPDPSKISSLKIQGQVKIADINLEAKLLFYAWQPKVMAMSFEQSISIETIIDGIINLTAPPGKAVKWQKQMYPDITLEKGSIYNTYIEEHEDALLDPDKPEVQYHPGFNIQCTMTAYSKRAQAHLHIFQNGCGFRLIGVLEEPINLGCLRLRGKAVPVPVGANKQLEVKEPGPSFKYVLNKCSDDSNNAGPTRFQMDAEFSLFNSIWISCKISFIAVDRVHHGLYYFGKNELGDYDSAVRIMYSDGAFWINDLNITRVYEALNLADAIVKCSESNDPYGCGKLAGLIFDRILKFKFTFIIRLNFTENGFKAIINPKLQLLFTDGKIVVREFPLPEWKSHLVLNVTNADGLITWLRELAVGEFLQSAAQYILDNPLIFTEILAWMSVREFSKKLIGRLLCRKVSPDNVKRRQKELFEPKTPKPPPPPKPEDKCHCRGEGMEKFICILGSSWNVPGRW